MRILIKLLKIVGALVLLGAFAIGALVAYDNHQSNLRKQTELAYETNGTWEWHDEYNQIQITSPDELGKSILRKVNMHDNYIVYAYKTDDYKLGAMVKFVTKCKPDSKIETSKKYSDGKPIVLSCNKEGTALTYSASWDGDDTDFVWNEDIDGFKFYVNFGDWDFTKLDQEITLSKAK